MEEDEPRPAEPLSNDGFLAALTARILAGERVEPGPLCDERPELASAIREICQNAERIAKQLGTDAEKSAGDTVRVTPESRSGSFDAFLETLRTRVGPDRYRMRGEIAVGGMGAILRVEDQVLNRPLAMKVILGQGDVAPTGQTPPVDDRTLGRFLDEAQVTAQLDHPGIVPIHELGIDATGRVYFTMKLVKGETNAEVFEKVATGADGWNLPRALGSLLRVAEAMAYAHDKRVLHRDLKPSNVMVGRFGEVFVMDWGLARILGEPDRRDLRFAGNTTGTRVTSPRQMHAEETPDTPLVTMDGDVVGTPAYMPPEQAEGRLEDVGPRSDVYSFGAMLYHLLVGHSPYVNPGARVSARTILAMVVRGPPEPVTQLAPSAPPMLVAICEKAMQRRASERYGDMTELAADLRAYLEGRVVRAYRTGAVAEIVQWTRRNTATAMSVAVAVLLVAGLTIGFIYQLRAHSKELFKSNTDLAKTNADLVTAQNAAAASATAQRWADYVANIRGASAAIESGWLDVAARFLASCPKEYRSWEWHHLALMQDSSLLTIQAHESNHSFRSVVWSPDGKRLYSASWAGGARVFDSSSGERLAELVDPYGSVDDIAVSDDSRYVAVLHGDTVHLFDGPTLQPIWRRNESKAANALGSDLNRISFSHDGDLLALVGNHGLLVLLDSKTGTCHQIIPLAQKDIECIAFHPTLPVVAVGGRNASVEVIDYSFCPKQLMLNQIVDQEFNYVTSALCFSATGDRLFATSGVGKLVVFETGRYTRLTEGDWLWASNDLDARNDFVAGIPSESTGINERAQVLQIDRMSIVGVARDPDGHEPEAVAFNPSGDRIAVGCVDGKIHVFSATGLPNPTPIARGLGFVRSVAMPRDKHVLAITGNSRTEGADRCIALSELGKGECWNKRATYADFESISISANGERVALIVGNKHVEVLSARTGEVIVTRTYSDLTPEICSLDPDGRFLALGGHGWLELIDIDSSHVVARREFEGRWLSALSLSRGGERIAALQRDSLGRVLVWTPHENSSSTFTCEDSYSAFGISPDGMRIAISGSRVRIYASATGEQLALLPGVYKADALLGWSEDGETLFGFDRDHSMLVWRSSIVAALGDWKREDPIQRCRSRVNELYARHRWPVAIERAIRDDPMLDSAEREFMFEVWNGWGNEYAEKWANQILEVCSRSNRATDEYLLALRRAEAAMQVARGGTAPIRALGAALFRSHRLEQCKAAFLESHFLTTSNLFLPEERWDLDDDLQAWLALTDAALGNSADARQWL